MKTIFITIAGMFFCFALCLAPGEAGAISCGNQTLSAGDSTDKVIKICGKPVKREKTKIKDPDGTAKKAGRILDSRSNQWKYRDKSKVVEKWTYDCGKKDYMRILTFENGTLRKEETGGRGKGTAMCTGSK